MTGAEQTAHEQTPCRVLQCPAGQQLPRVKIKKKKEKLGLTTFNTEINFRKSKIREQSSETLRGVGYVSWG